MPAQRSKKKKREPLTRDRILDAALVCIERDGLPALSMRVLGAELGVEAMSLYHHFPSKQHLCDAMLDRLIAAIPPIERGVSLREAMRGVALNYRAALRKQPALAPFAVTHRMNTRVGLTYLESILRTSLDAGLSPEHAARSFRAFCYYLMGAVLDETSGYARGPTAADALTPEQQAELAPSVALVNPYFAEAQWDETFTRGLEQMLDLLDLEPHEARR